MLLVWMGVCATALAQTTASLPSTAIHDKHVLIPVTAEVGGAGVDNYVQGMLKNLREGVETQEQRDFLELHGCHAYQGYFFSRPLSQAAFANYLAAQRPKSGA
jgi:hypothetical protein